MQAEGNSFLAQLGGTRNCGQHTRHFPTFPKSRDQLAPLGLGSLDRGLQFVRGHVRVAVAQSTPQSLQPRIKLR
jgi:hypothetical protein